jgi:NAD(P)-dependent dehydrogenase (short-subunit alcohol dehydrogenase family)
MGPTNAEPAAGVLSGRRLLEGKRTLVTGGSRGLGRALCRVFTEEGARVAFTWTRDELAAASLAEARGFRVSVLDVAATAAMVSELERDWGGIDVLVNNAGLTQVMPLALIDGDDWDGVLDVNLKGAFLTSKAVLPGMVRGRGGVILNIGSLAGSRLIAAPVHYCASKGGVEAMTRAMAKELARYGIRVLCLAPGLLDDGMSKNIPPSALAEYLRHCALGRLGTVEEAARLAAFLVSDRNSYMNGETVVLDGGL